MCERFERAAKNNIVELPDNAARGRRELLHKGIFVFLFNLLGAGLNRIPT